MVTQDDDGRGTDPLDASSAAGAAVATAGVLRSVDDLDVEVAIELGRRRLTLDEALALGEQSLLPLDRVVGEPVDLCLNGRVFARGEVVTVGEYFAVRLTEVLSVAAEA
jgi:flagellar motor switch protein FliN/FliY